MSAAELREMKPREREIYLSGQRAAERRPWGPALLIGLVCGAALGALVRGLF